MSGIKSAAIGAAVAAVVSGATVAVAGTGVGDVFNLGKTNSVNAQSILTGNAGSVAQLKVQNTGGGPALSAVVNSGVAPFAVGSNVKVANLNADRVDGKDATAFLPSSGDINLWYSPFDYGKFAGTFTLSPGLGPKVTVTSSAATGNSIFLPLDQPQTLFGAALKVKEVDICYDVSNSRTKIDSTQLNYGDKGQNFGIVNDGTDETSTTAACYSEAPVSPAIVPGPLWLKLFLSFGDTSDSIDLYSVKLTIGT